MEKIGRFEIVGKLGRGAFGMVYKGQDPIIKRVAAIKVMSEASVGDPDMVARFRREAEAAGGLNHRNIVTIYELGEHNNLPYIAMEFLEGIDLERLLRDRTDVPMEKRIDYLAQIAEGLQYAHSKGVIHRDIKPANVRLLADGTIKIMDFGIAKLSGSDMTRTGQFIGTVNYMSPEQIKARQLDGRSDIFAVGCLAYELVSHRRPFPGDSVTAVIYKIVNENPAPLSELHGTEYEWLEGVILRCLEKDAELRFHSCAELSQALRSRQRVQVAAAESPLDATLNLAAIKADRGEFDSALNDLKKVLDQDPSNVLALRQRQTIMGTRIVREAESLIGQGRLEQAREELLKAKTAIGDVEALNRSLEDLDRKIKATKAQQILGNAQRHIQDRRFETAIGLLDQARELDPYNDAIAAAAALAQDEKLKADVAELLADARSRFEHGQLAEARAQAQKALALDPQSRDARTLSQAIDREDELLRRRTGLTDQVASGKLALTRGEFDTAIQAFTEVLKTDPKNAEATSLLDQARREKTKIDEKKALLELIARGNAQLAGKQFDEALLTFERALKADPGLDDARRGLEAAQKRRAAASPAAAPSRRGLALAVGAVVLAVLAGLLWLKTAKPSPVALALKQGEQAAAPAQALEIYLAALGLDARPEERAAVQEKVDSLYQPLVAAGDLERARQVLDKVSAWKGAEAMRPRYADLGAQLARRGLEKKDPALLKQALASYELSFPPTYDPSRDEAALRAYLAIADGALASARDGQLDRQARLDLYAVAASGLARVTERDPGLVEIETSLAVRAEPRWLEQAAARAAKLETELASLSQEAAAAADGNDFTNALQKYDAVIGLCRYNSDLAPVADLAGTRQQAEEAIGSLFERIGQATRNPGNLGELVATLQTTARALEASGNLARARRQYEQLMLVPRLDVDSSAETGDAQSQAKIDELTARIEQLDTVKTTIRAALGAGDLAAAEARLAEALSLARSDSELAGLKGEIERQQASRAQLDRLTAELAEVDRRIAAGDLKTAETRLAALADSAADRDAVALVARRLITLRNRQTEAEALPIKLAAGDLESKGDLAGARDKWSEILRRNPYFPEARQSFDRLTRILNKDRIAQAVGTLTTELQRSPRDAQALARAIAELKQLDPRNPEIERLEAESRRDGAIHAAEEALDRLAVDEAGRALQGLDPNDPRVKLLLRKVRDLRQGLAALERVEDLVATQSPGAATPADKVVKMAESLGLAEFSRRANDALARARSVDATTQ